MEEIESWLARDEDGSLYLFFREKPQKMQAYGIIKLTAG